MPNRSKLVRVVLLLALAMGSAASAHAQAASPALTLDALKDDLAAANRILADLQVVDAFGHVSVRHPARPDRFLMGRNLAPALVTPSDIVEYDLDGKPVDPPQGATHFLERFIHAEILRARPDVMSVIHSHSPAVIPFGTTKAPLRPMYHMSAFLAPGVPVFEIRQSGGMTNMLVNSGQLGKALAATLGDKSVALMRGHGSVVVASTLPMAVFRAYYTETNARLQLQAIGIGGEITFLEKEEGEKAAEVLDTIHLRAWSLWKEKVRAK